MTCRHHNHSRTPLLTAASTNIANFASLNNVEKFTAIMNSKEPVIIKVLGNFINKLM